MISTIPAMALLIISLLALKNVRHTRAIPREKRDRVRAMTKKDFQLLQCLFVHNIVSILCNILILVAVVYGIIYPTQQQTIMQQALMNLLYNFGAVLHHIPYCASFFIFISVSKAFRLCNQHLNIVQEENQLQELIGTGHIPMNDVPVSTINLPK